MLVTCLTSLSKPHACRESLSQVKVRLYNRRAQFRPALEHSLLLGLEEPTLAKRRSFWVMVALASILLVTLLSAGPPSQVAGPTGPRNRTQATTPATLEAAELPADTKTLILDKPLV